MYTLQGSSQGGMRGGGGGGGGVGDAAPPPHTHFHAFSCHSTKMLSIVSTFKRVHKGTCVWGDVRCSLRTLHFALQDSYFENGKMGYG